MKLKYPTNVHWWDGDDFTPTDAYIKTITHMGHVASKNFDKIFDNINNDIILPNFLRFDVLKGEVIKINSSGLITDTGFVIPRDMIDLNDSWYGGNYYMIFYYLYHHL